MTRLAPLPRTDQTRAAIALANRQQGMASDPDVSAFVSASAGSGKTKLLIDRLLRLMLPRIAPADPERRLVPGTDPARIQCLTFTKAAAAEMAIRLQRELGGWVTLDDAALDRRLLALGCVGGAALRQPARALFARVLDLPGGMRIGTIHAFCQSLLRRFPVEARVSPHFRLVEETDARIALNRAWEAVLAERSIAGDADGALDLLAGQVQAVDAVRLLETLQHKAPALDHTLAALADDPDRVRRRLRRIAGITHADDEACLLAGLSPPDEAGMRALLQLAIAVGPPALRQRSQRMADWLAQAHPERAAAWPVWRGLFLTTEGKPRASGAFVAGKLAKSDPEIADALVAEAERVAAVEDSRRAIRTVALTMALLQLSGPVLRRYADGKATQGLVDYDDLIGRTLALLRDPGSAWVLYKLDGGIDHLLLDEVQDTSDLQWRIAHALTDEFFAGQGAERGAGDRVLPRTVFAVGDYKQSIYSFQDADPDAFHHWHERFRGRVVQADQFWREPELTVSFRSTVPVLALVDAVFAAPDAAQGVQEPGRDGAIRHVSARPDAPGSVELWPLVPAPARDDDAAGDADADDPDPWAAPTRNRSQATAQQRLAEQLARFIAGEIGRPHETGGAPLAAGEVLVLVPRRSAFVRALIRALKSEGVPVATLVRTGLADQIAVRDLMALCDALLLPQDDLSVACVLTSPLGGLSDHGLMALATGRGERSLWEQLRARVEEHPGEHPDWDRAWFMLSTLFGRVDFVSPHALLGEALGRLGGRARLLARLGPEAAEPVDELLSAALRHAETHPPSLQGFLHWLRRSEESIKREPDAAGDAVRVMTVHGAKGLQARLVVLPDTTGNRPMDDTLLWNKETGPSADNAGGAGSLTVPLWVPRAELGSAPTRRLRDRMRAASAEEANRLLYVALTRAADRLVVCGWEAGRRTGDGAPDGSWYALCRAGFEAAGAMPCSFGLGWAGDRLVLSQHAVAPDGSGSASPHPVPTALEASEARATDVRASPGDGAGAGAGAAVGAGAGAGVGVGAGTGASAASTLDAATLPNRSLPSRSLPDRSLPDRSLPAWAGSAPFWSALPPPPEPPLPRPLAPSRPDDVELGPVPALRSPLENGAGRPGAAGPQRRADAFRRGRLLHALLQHLPDLPPGARDAAAMRFLCSGPDGLDAAEAAGVVARLATVLSHRDLGPLFTPDALAEQPVSGLVDGVVVTGRIDRMRVLPDRVLLCDFKTNRHTPAAPERTPLPYLRQMSAYRALLGILYPDRRIDCALVWTEDATVSMLSPALLEMHRPGTYRMRENAGRLDPAPPAAHLGNHETRG